MSTSPTKEASPTKADKPTFTEKEERVLKAAWSCLKSPPEIDIDKLKIAADFNTNKTAQNTWGVIKKKLNALNATSGAEGEGEDGASTPSKTKSTPKRRGKNAATAYDEGETGNDDGESPTKKRKTPKKGTKTKAGADEDAEAVKGEPAADGAE